MDPSDDIIQLIVEGGIYGADCLNVHDGILCYSSKFFQNALKPGWTNMNAESRTIDLSNYPVGTVSDYIKWLYTNKISIDLRLEAAEDDDEERAEQIEEIFIALARAYVFGGKIIDARYKNAVLQKLFKAQKILDWHMGSESVEIIYEGTPPESPLRRLVADVVACKACDDADEGTGRMQFFDDYPREALVDALKAVARVRTSTSGYPGVESYLEKW
ncbi:hypothetical protein ACET3X_009348 [Alternaria dauci]|uniref:BTB domain-containing protein n=1 Tax=Alternaria dauci TaxID=48095 RepID=A0ABR3U8M6_9PLEO